MLSNPERIQLVPAPETSMIPKVGTGFRDDHAQTTRTMMPVRLDDGLADIKRATRAHCADVSRRLDRGTLGR
jgi:hypothetical protein